MALKISTIVYSFHSWPQATASQPCCANKQVRLQNVMRAHHKVSGIRERRIFFVRVSSTMIKYRMFRRLPPPCVPFTHWQAENALFFFVSFWHAFLRSTLNGPRRTRTKDFHSSNVMKWKKVNRLQCVKSDRIFGRKTYPNRSMRCRCRSDSNP